MPHTRLFRRTATKLPFYTPANKMGHRGPPVALIFFQALEFAHNSILFEEEIGILAQIHTTRREQVFIDTLSGMGR
jgi:hypothetical protein